MLDFKSSIQGLLGVHSHYGLHTRAVTVFRDTLSEGFSHFVTSIAAPVASGWSGCRVGFAPTGKRRLVTAHGASRHSANCPKTTLMTLSGPDAPFHLSARWLGSPDLIGPTARRQRVSLRGRWSLEGICDG